MADWNGQSAPNNNIPVVTLRSSKLVGKDGLQNKGVSDNVSGEKKGDDELMEQLRSHQPGMG